MAKWKKGNAGVFWDDEYKNFVYTRQPVTQEEIDNWVSKGYDHVKSFTGSMYDSRNPMPDWVHRFNKIFGHVWLNPTYTFYKMSTLEIMPEHVDHYSTYMRLFGAEYKNVCRILVMLEDWKPGHYLEIDGTGIVNWLAGDYFIWESDTPHAAANIGVDDRYTLQITCEKIEADEPIWSTEQIWKNIHWYNIPGLRTIKESTSPMMLRIIDCIDNNKGKPWMVYMYNQEIAPLEKIVHSQETIDYLNKHGLDLYLYEPICSYVDGAPQLYPPKGTMHNMWFYSEFNGKEDPATLRCEELESIQRYITRNNLTNVTVRACDNRMDTYYPYYTDKMKLVGDDLFVKTLIPIEVLDETPSVDFTKKFICLNWRYAPHRNLIASYVSASGDNYVSWYFKSDVNYISKRVWYDLNEWAAINPTVHAKMMQGLENINQNAPLCVDVTIPEAIEFTHEYFIDCWPKNTIAGITPANNNPHTHVLEKFYRDIFCDIVTETRFAQPTSNYSEKVYQPMYYKKPFILCAPPGSLQWLRAEGFQTFGEFWDETYDYYEDHQQRLFKIFEIIDFLNNKSIEELQEMYKKMIPILEYNRQHLATKVKAI
jgi:hypothetical protein